MGYFYLYDIEGPEKQKILGAVRVVVGEPDFAVEDLEVRWDPSGRTVGLFIRSVLWAAFDREEAFGGGYSRGSTPHIPSGVAELLKREPN